jgi:imidazolonepropionase-like amidohydrolase
MGQSSLGRISAGAIADLVVLDGDPSETAAAYRHVSGVFLGGRKVDIKAQR